MSDALADGLARGYIPHTEADVREMLEVIRAGGGPADLDGLFDGIPQPCRLGRHLDLPAALDEQSLELHMRSLAARNASPSSAVCFLGGGAYDHFVPAVVDQLAARGEFYTSYTPYQAEASQGNLQVYFEYQSLIASLTGMEVSNMSLYDGASAAAEAVLMALATAPDKKRVVLSATAHPEYREVVTTYLANLGVDVVTAPHSGGVLEAETLAHYVDDRTACVLLQQPNFFGCIEDLSALTTAAHERGALVAAAVDPVSLGVLARPGDLGVDLVVAEGQGLGNHLAYGGPYLGILACRESFVRRIPGRLTGQTLDRRGNRCWVLTLQTREQHIRREKATSNVCTNQGLLALRSAIHLAVLGPQGLREVAAACLAKAAYARQKLLATGRLDAAFDRPVFKEFVLRSGRDRPAQLVDELLARGHLAGVPLGRWYPELDDCLLVAVTEKRTRSEIDDFAAAVAALPATSRGDRHAERSGHAAAV
ncbi:MAG: aminomethyl-transferring glycine dehydrogenase subunit GcvPA [Planctomycetia bacterium]|nr:aminomethyl-transferring glycine dehydrogenase subunit GcvPA [Planctomycetia bacterium]